MLVRPIKDYIRTKGTNIPIKALDNQKLYNVIIENKSFFGNKTFYLVDDMITEFPTEWQSRLFQVVDSDRKDWKTSKHVKGFSGTVSCKAELLRLLENDPRYFERLVDGESDAVKSFKLIFPNIIRP